MKPTAAISLFLLLGSCWNIPAASAAAKCGDPWREPCLSESDPRYDSDANYDLKDQHDMWKLSEGYYEEDVFQYEANGQPKLTTAADIPGVGIVLFSVFPFKMFTNVTVVGSRAFLHSYLILSPSDGGMFGMAAALDGFSTSTFELDGSAMALPIQDTYAARVDPEIASITHVVGNDTFFGKAFSGSNNDGFATLALTCIDATCDSKQSVSYGVQNGVFVAFQKSSSTRRNKDKWTSAISQTYDAYKVPAQVRSPVPMTNTSLVNQYPSESQWCTYDPYCAEDKPYNEVTTPVKPGIIAGFSVLGIALLLAVLFVAFRIHSKAQAKRYRTIFATRVAQTMSIKVSANRMDAEALAREFQKIDSKATSGNAGANGRRSSVSGKGGTGQISKVDMWEFLSSGKACVIRESDFEALWAVMDNDGNGYLDFLEFCAFMGQCHEEYDNARNDRALMAERLSRKLSMRMIPPEDMAGLDISEEMPGISEADAQGKDEDESKAEDGA